MKIGEFWPSAIVERLKERWGRTSAYMRQEHIKKRLKITLLVFLFVLFPQLTIIGLLGRWAYKRFKKRSEGAEAVRTKEDLEEENRRLRAAKWELEERVSDLDAKDSRAFIANLNKIYAAFDVEISRINANENLPPYAKALRVRDWEALRDIQIAKFLEPQK